MAAATTRELLRHHRRSGRRVAVNCRRWIALLTSMPCLRLPRRKPRKCHRQVGGLPVVVVVVELVIVEQTATGPRQSRDCDAEVRRTARRRRMEARDVDGSRAISSILCQVRLQRGGSRSAARQKCRAGGRVAAAAQIRRTASDSNMFSLPGLVVTSAHKPAARGLGDGGKAAISYVVQEGRSPDVPRPQHESGDRPGNAIFIRCSGGRFTGGRGRATQSAVP